MKIDLSRVALLVGLVALVVVVTGIDVSRFFSFSLPGNALFWVGVALLIFYATRGGCCGNTCRDSEESADAG